MADKKPCAHETNRRHNERVLPARSTEARDASAAEFVMGDHTFSVRVAAPMLRCIAKYGPRFDTSAAIVQINMNGQNLLAGEGLIDEFNIGPSIAPPGYHQAGVGRSFLKIGVGELTRDREKHYEFSREYPVRHLVTSVASRMTDALMVSQVFHMNVDWGYAYTKTYRVDAAHAMLRIEYELTNTGRQLLHVEQYNHNWLNFAAEAPGPEYAVEPEFATHRPLPDWLLVDGQSLSPAHSVSQPSYFPSPFSGPVARNGLRVTHRPTERSVLIRGDFPVARFALFADATAICPEVFVAMVIAPNRTSRWTRSYEFCAKLRKHTGHDEEVDHASSISI